MGPISCPHIFLVRVKVPQRGLARNGFASAVPAGIHSFQVFIDRGKALQPYNAVKPGEKHEKSATEIMRTSSILCNIAC
jgi:hypothetical protein